MRRALPLLMVLLACIHVPVQAQPDGPVQLAEIHPRPVSGEREFIELWNAGNEPQDLQGWSLTDGTNTFVFDTWSVPANGRVVVWGGGNASATGPAWKPNVWNNGGDVVELHDAAGALMDRMAYGTPEIPAPAEGQSLHQHGGWYEAPPTPGQGPDAHDGAASAEVEDVPPVLEWLAVPVSVRAGDNASVTFRVTDGNGDPVQWHVLIEGTAHANGTASQATVVATAPARTGPWNWTVRAVSTHHDLEWGIDVDVVAGAFQVALPPEGILFEGLVPGAEDVAAVAPFRIVNRLNEPAVPHLDVSPFQGTEAVIPVDGNLRLGIVHEGGESHWLTYQGPLHPLPELAGGASYEVWLVLHHVPSPLPAGRYPGTFTVVE